MKKKLIRRHKTVIMMQQVSDINHNFKERPK